MTSTAARGPSAPDRPGVAHPAQARDHCLAFADAVRAREVGQPVHQADSLCGRTV
jgi:hypothetical protein